MANTPNTSATGGYLRQTSVSLEGIALRRYISDVLVALTGLDENAVVPSWQPDQPPRPDVTVDWLAFGITTFAAPGTTYYVQHETTASQIRYEEMAVLCTFYGPSCLALASALRDALELPQNRDGLVAAGLNYAGHSDITHVPELIDGRRFDRADITLTIRRAIRREYQILPFLQAAVAIHGAANVNVIETRRRSNGWIEH